MSYFAKLQYLCAQCGGDADLRESLEDMVLAAGEYVNLVVRNETMAAGLALRAGEERRAAVAESDAARTAAHNRLIAAVDLAGRICLLLGEEPLYTGGAARREYADFAFELVREIYERRQ